MKKGQRILVRAYPDKILERVVLKEEHTYVVVCRPEIYETIREDEDIPDTVMAFPKEDIVKILEPVASE